MPFQSEKQRRYLWANEPEIARDWTDTYGSRIDKNSGGIMRVPFITGSDPYLPTFNPEFNTGNPYQDNIWQGWDTSNLLNNEDRNEARYVSSDHIMNDANIVDDVDEGIAGLSTDVFTPPAYETFNKDPNWWQEETGVDMIGNPNFPLRKENLQELYETGKENLGGILESGIDKAKWLKKAAMTGIGKAINFPIGLASMLGGSPDNPYQKFQKEMFSEAGYSGDANKDPWGKNVRSFKDTYDVTDQWDKFSGSKLGQKYNLAELGADGLTEAEIQGLIDSGLKGYQLKRAIGLSKFNQRARTWKKQKDDAIKQKEIDRERRREEARKKAAKDKAAAEQAAFQSKLDQAYNKYGGGNNQGGGGRYDGASSKAEWSADPTGYSGSFAEGGLANLWHKR